MKKGNCKKLFSLIAVVVVLFAGCSKRSNEKEDMNFEELKAMAITEFSGKKSEKAITYLEEMVSRFPERRDISQYKIMLADLYLNDGSLDAAYELYKNYSTMYPGDSKAEYATYRTILAKFYKTLKVSSKCDQTDTEITLVLCKDYLKEPTFYEYQDDVKDINYTCERRLIDKEVYVFNSYLRKKKFKSAQNRLNYLQNTFLKKHQSLEPQILFLECRLAHKQNDEEALRGKVDTLMQKFNDSQYTRMAMGIVDKKSKKRFLW